MDYGIYTGIEAERYHKDPGKGMTLNSSSANILIDETPFRAWLQHPKGGNKPKVPTEDMEFGSVVHSLLVGGGREVVEVDAPDWRKKEAQVARAEARAKGLIPILPKTKRRANAVAVATKMACRKETDLSKNLETVLYWQEEEYGIDCRAMVDHFLLNEVSLDAYDVKIVSSLSDAFIASRISSGLEVQAWLYLRGLSQFIERREYTWTWIFCEADEPYGTRILRADNTHLVMGEKKARYAMAKWFECLKDDCWPDYPQGVQPAPAYPAWAENQWLARELREAEID